MDNFLILKIFITIFMMLAYAFYGYALKTMSKINKTEDLSYLSFVPIGNMYLLGVISGPMDIFDNYLDEKKVGFLSVSKSLLFIIISYTPYLKFLYKPIMLLILFFNYKIFTNLFIRFGEKDYKNKALIFTFATAVIQIFFNIFLILVLSLPRSIAFYIHIISLFMYILAPAMYIYNNRYNFNPEL